MKTQQVIFAAVVALSALSCSRPETSKGHQITFADSLDIFAEGLISTVHKERDLAISRDGKRMLFTRSAQNGTFSVILETVKQGDNWSEPEVAPFSGSYSDLEPAFSPDGKTLYFASNRPVTGTKPKDFDLWKVSLEDDQWGRPERLDTLINTTGNEFYPSVSKNGNLYFTASPDFKKKKEDIYIAKKTSEGYAAPTLLSDSINTAYYEFNAFIDPDERFIIFSSWGRPDGKGGGDLYLCRKGPDGNWQQARPLSVNTEALEYCPLVSSDGKYLFFTRNSNRIREFYKTPVTASEFNNILSSNHNGNGDIWIMPFDEIFSAN